MLSFDNNNGVLFEEFQSACLRKSISTCNLVSKAKAGMSSSSPDKVIVSEWVLFLLKKIKIENIERLLFKCSRDYFVESLFQVQLELIHQGATAQSMM